MTLYHFASGQGRGIVLELLQSLHSPACQIGCNSAERVTNQKIYAYHNLALDETVALCHSAFLNSALLTLPLMVFSKLETTSTFRGYLYGAAFDLQKFCSSETSLV